MNIKFGAITLVFVLLIVLQLAIVGYIQYLLLAGVQGTAVDLYRRDIIKQEGVRVELSERYSGDEFRDMAQLFNLPKATLFVNIYLVISIALIIIWFIHGRIAFNHSDGKH